MVVKAYTMTDDDDDADNEPIRLRISICNIMSAMNLEVTMRKEVLWKKR